MNQGVIQDFLNLPGIAGIALMNEYSRAFVRPGDCAGDDPLGDSAPVSCAPVGCAPVEDAPVECAVVGCALNVQESEGLVRSILQIVETVPEKFELFKFKFSEYQAHLYQLKKGMILLVLTDQQLVPTDYLHRFGEFKAVLEAQPSSDIDHAIAEFQRITAKGLPLQTNKPKQNLGQDLEPSASDDLTEVALTASLATAPTTTVKEVIAALNELSQFTTQYLGTQVIVNYWKSTRPAQEWLRQFQLDRAGYFSVPNRTAEQLAQPISAEDQATIQGWVDAFIKRCSYVIRDFSNIIQQKALNPEQKCLLLGIQVK
jgi:hypothetical protein